MFLAGASLPMQGSRFAAAIHPTKNPRYLFEERLGVLEIGLGTLFGAKNRAA